MMDGIQVGEGDGTKPFKPRKIAIEAYPATNALWITPKRGKATFDWLLPGNWGVHPPHDGWAVYCLAPNRPAYPEGPVFIAESKKEAQAWAEQRYGIIGWQTISRIGIAAIPGKAPKA